MDNQEGGRRMILRTPCRTAAAADHSVDRDWFLRFGDYIFIYENFKLSHPDSCSFTAWGKFFIYLYLLKVIEPEPEPEANGLRFAI